MVVEPAGEKESSTKKPDPKGNRDGISPWELASEGTQMAITLLLGVFVGYKLDAHWKTSPWLTLAGSVLGIAVGMYGFLKRVLK